MRASILSASQIRQKIEDKIQLIGGTVDAFEHKKAAQNARLTQRVQESPQRVGRKARPGQVAMKGRRHPESLRMGPKQAQKRRASTQKSL